MSAPRNTYFYFVHVLFYCTFPHILFVLDVFWMFHHVEQFSWQPMIKQSSGCAKIS